MRQEIRVETLAEPISHYTDAVRFGDLVFLSGAAPVDKDRRLVGGDDVTLQTRQVMENIKAKLDYIGASFADILKVTVFVTDIDDRAAIDVVRKEFFGDSRPASTLIEVSAFVFPGMKVEIEAVVGIDSTRGHDPAERARDA